VVKGIPCHAAYGLEWSGGFGKSIVTAPWRMHYSHIPVSRYGLDRHGGEGLRKSKKIGSPERQQESGQAYGK
jgi:hypothetical protein